VQSRAGRVRQVFGVVTAVPGEVVEARQDQGESFKRRGRGKRAGRSLDRGPGKAATSPLGALLIAERAALLSRRDDEFVVCLLLAYTGMRWGEIVGLETEFVRPGSIRIE
jgi:hypothetical protein